MVVRGRDWELLRDVRPLRSKLPNQKEAFYEALQRILDGGRQETLILGDINGRVGNNILGYEKVLGRHGEVTRNDSGKRLLQFCINNNLAVYNTFYPHKDIHKYTREEPTLQQRSLIDYVVGSPDFRRRVRDVVVRRGPEIGSDHYLVVAVICGNRRPQKNRKKRKKNVKEKINVYKLKTQAQQDAYRDTVDGMIEEFQSWNDLDLEGTWAKFKEILLAGAAEICERQNCGRRMKKTRWWSVEVQEAVQVKKAAWKVYLEARTHETYGLYKIARREVKRLVKEAKKKAWEEYGYVRTANASSGEFPITMGVRQGDVLSPLIFILVMDEVLKECETKCRAFHLGNWRLQPVRFSALAFADDVMLLAKSEEALQHNLNIWDEELRKRGLRINLAKTKSMVIAREEIKHQNLRVGGELVEQVAEFKYLRATMSQSGKIKNELNARIAAGSRLFYALNRKFLSKDEVSPET
ncbi:hypothetical protein GE061_005665 [Apolygus lucorum]|uniref:Reverse transcriptase domain-containing protein n=1 Tax=Apolygus lucorum TaxID=248454 RepID=A0A8S9WYM6_APOLU|nr:hypothetical protein GE061_005665 [Apolygus lucorum]